MFGSLFPHRMDITRKGRTVMVQKAAEFAAKAHEGTLRKGSNMPYIVHPKEVAAIVAVMNGDQEEIAAAYLHDVIEDAGITYGQLLEAFGRRVADLVLAESEDKSKSWIERKQATVERLRTATREEKRITFADKLSNLRSTAEDYLAMGDVVWQKFRQKEKAMHAWYYRSVFESFDDFREFPFYREYEMLLKMVFGDIA